MLLLTCAASALVGGFAAACGAAPTAETVEDPWLDLRPLLGRWDGEGSGFGIVSTVSHEWDLAVRGQFLRLRTRSVSLLPDGGEELHEDVGYLSRDTDTGGLVFRQFFSEGFVNTYDVKVEAGETPRIVFEHRETESAGGMGARMHLTFTGPDRYDAVLELAAPGKEFTPCQRMTMTRRE